MKKFLIIFAIFFIFCSKGNLEKEYKKLEASLENSKNNEEKAKIIEDFLKKYPDTEYTYDLAWELLNYENPENYAFFIQNLKKKIKNEENLNEINYCLLDAYKRTKDKEKIIEVFNSFKKPLDYYNYSETVKALLEAEDFEGSLKLLDEAKKLCTMDYIEKKYEKLSQERRKRYFNRWNFEVEFLKGRALKGLKNYEEALNSFERAKGFLKPSFQGTYMDNFNLHLAATLKEMGRKEEAINTIIPDVLFEKNEENFGFFKEIYKEIYNSEEGIEEFLKAKKEETSPSFMDFTLKDYEGREFNFKEISKDKVTLLTFWFPT